MQGLDARVGPLGVLGSHAPRGTAGWAKGVNQKMAGTVDRHLHDPDAHVVRSYGSREIILFPGPPQDLYRLRNGLVRLHRVDRAGGALTLRYVKPGGYFGEEALGGWPRTYFAEAVTSSEVETVSPTDLDAASLQELTHYLAGTVGNLYHRLERLAGRRLSVRVAAVLLELIDSAVSSRNAAGEVVIYVTHDELAAAVGAVRETVTKAVGELARSGAIHGGYGRIMVRDVARLQAEADG